MCVLVTVVEPAMAASRKIMRTKFHIMVESLWAEDAIADAPMGSSC
jgi:hypothetical protein